MDVDTDVDDEVCPIIHIKNDIGEKEEIKKNNLNIKEIISNVKTDLKSTKTLACNAKHARKCIQHLQRRERTMKFLSTINFNNHPWALANIQNNSS